MLRRSLLFIAVAAVIAAPVRADHIRGIKVSVTSSNAVSGDVDISVIEYVVYATGTDSTDIGRNTPNAVEWGDGLSTIADGTVTRVASDPPNQYKANFSHTYATPGAGPYTIRVASATNASYNFGQTVTGVPHTDSGATVTSAEQFIRYFTNTTAVFSAVPAQRPWALAALGLALLTAGALILLKR